MTNSAAARELETYIGKLEAYESGEIDAVPYVPAQTLIRAKDEIEELSRQLKIATDDDVSRMLERVKRI